MFIHERTSQDVQLQFQVLLIGNPTCIDSSAVKRSDPRSVVFTYGRRAFVTGRAGHFWYFLIFSIIKIYFLHFLSSKYDWEWAF